MNRVNHIAMGNSGGGVANLGVVGGNNKPGGCTGLTTPTGDFFAVDFVAHELGHQFNGRHTFNIQPHSDPYWVPKSYEEVLSLVTGDRPPISEVQNVSFRDFDGTDAFTLSWDGKTSAPIARGTNYTAAAVQNAIQGPSEVQQVALTGYDANGDSYRLSFRGASSPANVISTAGDAALAVTDPSSTAPGHLVNGFFVMPMALQARAGTTGAFATVGSAPATLKSYDGPISNDAVTLGFRQRVGASDALRTGTYSKTLTFTLSTTQP